LFGHLCSIVLVGQSLPTGCLFEQSEIEVEVEEGSLVPSMRETRPEGHYTVNH